ncbi:hypothetical protein [Priestia megaterium]|uniref:hypothetical protein n=1 Tax=Priestia megaterium TaxID=1404 RepID=UPI002E23D454|nr:hypothetical protein [Priestia megaterium]
MENFFKHALKVSIASLVIAIVLYVVILGVPLLVALKASTFAILIKVAVPTLIFVTVLGFIYSFFIKGKRKFVFLSLHFASLCIISFGIYIVIELRDFAP